MDRLERKMRGARRRLRWFAPRRFQCYCIGAAKTGTTSITSTFRARYRACHEPEASRTNRLVIDYLEGIIGRDEVMRRLVQRDRRLRLEMESAHPLGYLGGLLAETFPEARFIITLREPRAWLRSRLNYHYQTDPPAWRAYRDYFWVHRQGTHAPEEAPLQRYDLCPLDVYLAQYADHYRRVLHEVPEDRRLLVRTTNIGRRLPEIAAFLGVPAETLVASHRKRSGQKITPLQDMDEAFVRQRIRAHCGELIGRFFPERVGYYTSAVEG